LRKECEPERGIRGKAPQCERRRKKVDVKLLVGYWLVGSLVCCFFVLEKKMKKQKKH